MIDGSLLQEIKENHSKDSNNKSINDFSSDFIKLIQLSEQVKKCEDIEVIFDFSSCNFLRQNAVAFLGGLAKLINFRGGKAEFAWHTMKEKIFTNLEQNGFVFAFGGGIDRWQGNCIPYRQDLCNNIDERTEDVMSYLDDLWLGRGWIGVDQCTKSEVIVRVSELYSNAFEHSCSDIGVFTCGQRYPNINKLSLTIIDFGVGIPFNIRSHLNQESLPTLDALQWAFQAGHTTRHFFPGSSGCISGGTGLSMQILRRFVDDKQGKIDIYSHDGRVKITPKGDFYQSIPAFFEGTMINICLQCV